MTPLSTLTDLEHAVNALPPVAAGKVRVFRGQTSNYGQITPASYRKRLASRSVWSIYSRALLNRLDQRFAARHLAMDELLIQSLWLEAVAKHYSSGSSYLDVTHSIESAAWFALHAGVVVAEHEVPGALALSGSDTLTQEAAWVRYSPASEPGFLFVFDVDVWGGDGVPPHLALVDLCNAPDPLRSPRMLAQMGCLISAVESEQYDLQRHCVEGSPLRIAWPMTGSVVVNRRVEEMFPAPDVDPWFRLFLSAPLVPHVSASSGELILMRPVPVISYWGETAEYNSKVKATQWFLNPPLLHQTLQHIQVPAGSDKKDFLQQGIMSIATPIVLEAPLLNIFPSADSDLWNHELLVSDIGESVHFSTSTNGNAGCASLTNVLVQFSPLEEIFGDDMREPIANRRLTRGLWLFGEQGNFGAALIVQDFPHTSLFVDSPVKIRFDPARRRIIYQPLDPEARWAEVSSLQDLAKPLFVVLYLLRTLNPKMKVEATPLRHFVSHQGSTSTNGFSPSIYADPARLVRIDAPKGVGDWFVLRNAGNDDPFTTAVRASASVNLTTAAAFADFPAKSFETAVAAVVAKAGSTG